MSVQRTYITLTSSSTGAGTAISAEPISGEILELRNNSAGWGGTADYTFVRRSSDGGGGTVAALTDQAGPFSAYPRANATTTTGGGGTAIVPVPIDGHLELRLAEATVDTAGTIHVFYRC